MEHRQPRRDVMTLRARSVESLAGEFPLRFAAPFADHEDRTGFEQPWHLLQYAFDLTAPSTFPPLPMVPTEDLAVLNRYVAAAHEMAESTFLRQPVEVRVSFADGTVNRTFPPPENVRGFATLFRQFYSANELASFTKVKNLLMRLNTTCPDAESDRRRDEVARWARAAGQLRAYQLKTLVAKRLHAEGLWESPGPYAGERYSPEFLISLFNYGELVHWGDRRSEVAALEATPFDSAWTRWEFFESMAQLAHLYLGFALLVKAATSRSGERSTS